ncbi:MAG: hypothetical protein ACREBJ_04210, partial [Nitrosotalea sp.]
MAVQERTSMPKKLTLQEFINRANKIHAGKYDYSKSLYIKSEVKILIGCSIHGEFKQPPRDHLSGHGCRKCAYELTSKKLISNKDAFIKKALAIHGADTYSYDQFIYDGNKVRSNIKCLKHFLVFEQSPNHHLRGVGCPLCNASKGETT